MLWIFLLAIGVRFLYLFFLTDQYPFLNHPADDILYHRQWAQAIAFGESTSTTWFGLPLFPYFLASLLKLCFGQWNFVYLFYIFFTSLNCVLLYSIAKKIWSEPVAVVAACLCAINTNLVYYDVMLSPVGLLILISLFLVNWLMHYRDHFSPSHWFIPGLGFGLLALGDGKSVLFLGIIILIILWRDRQRFQFSLITKIIPLVFVFGLCVFLASLRNYHVGGSWVWISGQTGLSFYVGNNSYADGYYHNPDFIRPTHAGQDEDQKIVARQLSGNPNLNDKEVSRFWMKEGVQYLKTYPAQASKLWIKKFLIFWTDTEKAFDLDLILQKPWLKKWDLNPWVLMLPFTFIGLVVGCFRREKIEFISAAILAQICFTVIFFLTERHRSAILPFLIMFEASGVVFLFEQVRKHCWDCVIGCLFVVVLALIVSPREKLSAHYRDYLWMTKYAALSTSVGDYDKAIVSYQKALKYYPNDTNALYNLGNAYFQSKRFYEAEEKYVQVLRVNSLHVDALYNLGFTFEALKEFDSAKKIYGKLLFLSPDSDDVLFRLGYIASQEGNCVEAKQYVEKIQVHQALDLQLLNPIVQSCP